MKQNFTAIIQIDSNRPVSFGLKLRIYWIHPDWKFGLILIESGSFGLKTSFGFDRNKTVWCGYKFRNNSDWFGMNFNPKLLPGKLV